MERHGLFGHLVRRFSTSPENMATEALLYVFHHSSAARRAFLRFVAQTGVAQFPDLLFYSQAHGLDTAIPDLVGTDGHNRQVLLVEAKFWAPLTSNQPVTYLRRLPGDTGGILLFLAPESRFPTLWAELLQRCAEAGEPLAATTRGGEIWHGQVGPDRVLALASWRSVLAYLTHAAQAAGDAAAVEDLGQLAGLCNSMDQTAFLPLSSEELTGDIGRRVAQYGQLIEAVISRLRTEAVVSTAGLNPASAQGWFGRYMRAGDYGLLLKFDAQLWGAQRATPLWLRLQDARTAPWSFPRSAMDLLAPLAREDPPRLLVVGGDLVLPLRLPLGQEQEVIVQDLVRQIREIVDLFG